MAEDLTPQEGSGPTDLTPQDAAPEGAGNGGQQAAGVTPEKKADGQADADKTGAPETYADFKLPEGMEIDSAALEAFAPVAKELGLTQEQAQKLVDVQAGVISRFAEKMQADAETRINEWVETAQSDREIGGKEFDAKLQTALKAVRQFGTKELIEIFDATGVGNHPEMIRIFYRIGKAMQSDKFVFGNSSKPEKPKSAAEILFPTMAPGEY